MKIKAEITKEGMPSLEIEAQQQEMNNFFGRFMPSFGKPLGGMISDQVQYFRFVNQVRIVKKAKELMEKERLIMKDMPLKVLAPLMEHASMEEDETMQEKWSNLLVNATTGNKKVRPNYPEILKELSPVEVKTLDYLFTESISEGKMNNKTFLTDFLSRDCEIPKEDLELILEDLIRLNLIRYAPRKREYWENNESTELFVSNNTYGMGSTVVSEAFDDLYNSFRIGDKPDARDQGQEEIRKKLNDLQEKLMEIGLEDRSTIKMTALGFHFVNACKI